MKKRIITNKEVAATFEGTPAYLMRTIISSNTGLFGETRYVVQTDEVTWDETLIPQVDENNDPILDENGDQVNKTRRKLRVLSNRQKGGILQVSKAVSDALYGAIKDSLPVLADSFFDYQQAVEQSALLVETQQKSPWATNAEDWEVLELDDYIVEDV